MTRSGWSSRIPSLPVRSAPEIAPAFAAVAKEKAEGLIVVTDPLTWTTRRQIVELAEQSRTPAAYEAAAGLGLTSPQSVTVRADHVVR